MVPIVSPAQPHPTWRATNAQFVLAAAVEVSDAPSIISRGVGGLGVTGHAPLKKVAKLGGRTTLGLAPRSTTIKKITPAGGRVTLALTGTRTSEPVVVTGPFTHVLITRDYDLATGDAPSGGVFFTPSAWLVNGGITIPAAPVEARLDINGQIAISLAANTDPATTPTNTRYVVREEIVGQPTRIYAVQIPHDEGLAIDLSTLPVIGG